MKRHCGMWGHRLRHHGFKCTPGRELILETLEKNSEHMTAEDIYKSVSKNYPDLSLTSVYRTLDMLVRLDIIVKLDFGDGKSRFELAEKHSTKKHHHHLVCSICNKIIDYSDFIDEEINFLNSIEQKLEKKHNFKIKGHIISFYGLCKECIK